MSIALLFQQTAPVSRDQLREQIRDAVRAATEGARDAANQTATGAKATGSSGNKIVAPMAPAQSGTVQDSNPDFPPQVEPISIAFFAMIAIIVVGLPLMRAIARRIDRGTPVAPAIPREVRDQLQQISQAVDAIAIEVERISEGQRFTTKMLADRPQNLTVMSPGSSGQQQGPR